MHTFNTPPGWPDPPTPDWQPPPGWQPDPAWPPAPPGWSFWLNARGLRTRGPNGRYGAETPVRLVAGWVAAGVAFITILAAIGGSNSASSTASSSPVPGPTVTATVTGPTVTTTATTTVRQTVPGPTATITQPPLPARTVTVKAPQATITATREAPQARSTEDAGSVYYANCSEARAAGDTPLYTGDPGYASHLDRDTTVWPVNDPVACE